MQPGRVGTGASVHTVTHDTEAIRPSTNPGPLHPFHTDPTQPGGASSGKQEHFYAEIPPPPPSEPPPTIGSDPFHLTDLKSLDYNKPMGPPLSHSNRQSYGTTFSNSGSRAAGAAPSAAATGARLEDLDFDLYARMRSPLCVCNRQTTVHVLLMVVAGILYLGVGGIAGFYIGKMCEYFFLVLLYLILCTLCRSGSRFCSGWPHPLGFLTNPEAPDHEWKPPPQTPGFFLT